MQTDYELLDSGNGRKLERFGNITLIRPCAAAVWPPSLPAEKWKKADASFDREDGLNWTIKNPLPESWNVSIDGIVFKLNATDFGHVGVFPEQKDSWGKIRSILKNHSGGNQPSVLNLFAYSGGSTLAAAQAGATVCHLDASKGMVARARENAALNNLAAHPIRWIVEDVTKFLGREIKRGRKYDAIILDPPSFGRGKSGEVYKIENDLPDTLKQCFSLLSDRPLFVFLSCHTPSFTPMVLRNILTSLQPLKGDVDCGEMALAGSGSILPVPSGSWACWRRS